MRDLRISQLKLELRPRISVMDWLCIGVAVFGAAVFGAAYADWLGQVL